LDRTSYKQNSTGLKKMSKPFSEKSKMTSKNDIESPERPRNKAKRPLASPEETGASKKQDYATKNDEISISENLKAIRVASSLETHSYIASASNQTQPIRFRPSSEHSFTGNWNRGTTDVINVEILSVNGEEYKGSFKRPEALYIWTNVLGQDKTLVHGISFKSIPRRSLQIVFRLKNEISIDSTFSRDDFSYNRGEKKPDGSYDIVCRRILGMKTRQERSQPDRETRTRVNLYGCEFDLKKEQILNWMSKFGEIMSEPMDILDRDCPDIATGDISIIMKLSKQIPSFLPMYGKKIRVAYRGMSTICSNCYDVGHMRVACENERANYLDYVTMLMSTERFERSMFGNWANRAEKYQDYKREQNRSRQKNKTKTFETIEEESYIDPDSLNNDNLVDDDDRSTSSYLSTETVKDPENETTEPSEKNVCDKITSFESRSKNKQ